VLTHIARRGGEEAYGVIRIFIYCMKFQNIIKRLEYDVLLNVTQGLNSFSSGIQMTEIYNTI
jgi:hypothetical protein